MHEFEYQTETLHFSAPLFRKNYIDPKILEQELNKYGKDSWELSSSIDNVSNGHNESVILIFKRRILK